MIDLKTLKDRGITTENLQTWLQGDPNTWSVTPTSPSTTGMSASAGMTDIEKRARWIRRGRARIQDGMTRNFEDFPGYHALDKAWETPFRQISPTLLQDFVNSDPNDDKVYEAMKNWGLTNLISEETDPKSGKVTKKLNLPTFFQVLVPLVRAYTTIRWAKIMNDRMLTPFFDYSPTYQTAQMRLLCETITNRVQIISTQYGYFDVLKQGVLKMLHYGQCFQFPRKSWDFEQQCKYADPIDVALNKKKKGTQTPAEEGDEIEATEREGMSYHQPHPTRTFYDIGHGPDTFNHGYGCEFAGYWRIARYSDVLNSGFWNKDRIALGNTDIISAHTLFFQTAYAACTLKVPIKAQTQATAPSAVQPTSPTPAAAAAEVGIGVSSLDREAALGNQWYNSTMDDMGVLVTEYFEKLVPKDHGLGDYEYPVWFRFVFAGDGCTVLFAEPLPYDPVIYYGYDADTSRRKNPSLSLEVLPFQDQFSNMLTQIILTCKQNLANLSFVDEDQLELGDSRSQSTSRDTLDRIRNLGERMYRTLNIFGYSSKKAQRLQTGSRGIPDVVQSWSFPKGNVPEMTGVLMQILNILERVLVMSSQEVAQAASHELRVDEVRNIQQSTSSRLQFTAAPVDIAISAWKRQLYCGLMAYGDSEIWAHLPSDIVLTPDQMKQMGFTVAEGYDKFTHPKDQRTRYRIDKKSLKTAINMWEFASTRDGADRIDNTKTAQAMAALIQPLLANPMTAQAIGPDQAIEIANQVSRLAGLPRDFKLRNMTPQGQSGSPEDAQAEAHGQLKKVVDAVLAQVSPMMQQELQPLLTATKQNSADIALVMKALNMPVSAPQNDTSEPGSAGAQPPEQDQGMAQQPVGA